MHCFFVIALGENEKQHQIFMLQDILSLEKKKVNPF